MKALIFNMKCRLYIMSMRGRGRFLRMAWGELVLSGALLGATLLCGEKSCERIFGAVGAVGAPKNIARRRGRTCAPCARRNVMGVVCGARG